ncbi:hypothetical protein M426DRAFT_249147 [Hypoxylon sp. CI-4A]|nr:hypothetical protein M426DRAFT_249147 [Hypoxylon sp. CI-4A]
MDRKSDRRPRCCWSRNNARLFLERGRTEKTASTMREYHVETFEPKEFLCFFFFFFNSYYLLFLFITLLTLMLAPVWKSRRKGKWFGQGRQRQRQGNRKSFKWRNKGGLGNMLFRMIPYLHYTYTHTYIYIYTSPVLNWYFEFFFSPSHLMLLETVATFA